MEIHTWLAFVAASTALLLVPGPTILLVCSYALSHGRTVAVSTALGVALGDLIAMSASLLGLGALVLMSATLFTALKWVGAAYLIYLGYMMIKGAGGPGVAPTAEAERAGSRRVFAHAAAVTALNPKSIGFFIAFVPQFVDPNSDLMPQFAILVATFVGLAAFNALAYALLADRFRQHVSNPGYLVRLSRMSGGVLVAMGIATLTLRRANS